MRYGVLLQAAVVVVSLAHGTPGELATKARLDALLPKYDLRDYTFTQRVVIEQGVINHAFPTLTLNAHFDDDDQLLSAYVHEQIHWHLREHRFQQEAAIAELRRFYPRVPVGLPEGADTLYSTYGHIVTCYLEMIADRRLMGDERAAATIRGKRHYTWIYATVVRDEAKIAAVVARHGLGISDTRPAPPSR
jgi:hypothetical protein